MAHLLDEEVADLLQQNDEPRWLVVVFAVGPHQTHRVHQRADLTPRLRELHVLDVLKAPLQGLQIGADVVGLLQSCR